MIKRQRTFTCKYRFKETFRKLFFKATLILLHSYLVGFYFLPLQRLHGCEKQSKKGLTPKETTALGSINPASNKRADFSKGSRTSGLTFPALYSGEDGSARECYPTM